MLPAVAGLTLIFAVLRKELALQLLLAFAAVSVGGAVTGLDSFMSTSQIVTYAIVNTIYIPCLATIAVLGRELGWKRTAFISTGTIVLSLLVGGVVARLLPLHRRLTVAAPRGTPVRAARCVRAGVHRGRMAREDPRGPLCFPHPPPG